MKRNRLPLTLADALPLRRADDHRTDLTEAERERRMGVAMHEAGHLVAACHIGFPPRDAFVRVPGKTPKRAASGLDGYVTARGTAAQDAVIAIAGPIVNELLGTAGRGCQGDHAVYEKWAKCAVRWGDSAVSPATKKMRQELMAAVTSMIRCEWKVIDAVASCLLHCADATGYLNPALTASLVQLVTRCHANISRIPEFDGPMAACDVLGIEGPQLLVCRDYPFVRLSAPPDYRSPLLFAA